MSPKQKIFTIDVIAYAIISVVALTSLALVQAVGLLWPNPSLANNLPPLRTVTASAIAKLPSEDSDLAKTLRLSARIQMEIDNFVKQEPNSYGIYVKHLPTGATGQYNATDQFITASLYKPFAVIEALKQVESGDLKLNTVLVNTGGRTVEQCIWDTITVSDNPCGRALRSITRLTTEAGSEAIKADGYLNTVTTGDYPISSAQDIAKLFENIYYQELLTKKNNEMLLNALLNQRVNDRLPTGLPAGTKIAHKTGDLEGAAHDAGIVYTAHGDYIIVVLSGPDNTGRNLYQRYARFGELSARIYYAITNQEI